MYEGLVILIFTVLPSDLIGASNTPLKSSGVAVIKLPRLVPLNVKVLAGLLSGVTIT
jgi:hypothetical protein